MNLFDILGPVMVGPSSFYTAGSVKIGYIASKIPEDVAVHADITERIIEAMYVAAGIGQVIAARAYISGAAGG